jgi:hypothetical protein
VRARRGFVQVNTRLPDAIGIGAEKCGTVSLYYYLGAHPEIGVQRNKETGYFRGADRRRRGLAWYAGQFPADARTLVEVHGGGYTAYPRERGVAERIHAAVPEARLFYLVRDPIERVISRWVHNVALGVERRPIELALSDLEDVEYVPQSLYYMQLEQYLPLFDADKILIIRQEDLLRRRRETLRELFRFLGVREDFWHPRYDTIYHSSSAKRRRNRLGMLVHRLVGARVSRALPMRQRYLFQKLVYTPLSTKIERPTLDPAFRARLRKIFEDDVSKLEAFAGKRFEGWLEPGPT